jgi:hypothetical protein
MTLLTCKFKPSSSIKTQLLLAASLWTLVGCGLLGFGLVWMFGSGSRWTFLLLLVAIVVGGIKGYFVLRKTSTRATNRIQNRGDGTCIFGVFSVWQWLLVGVMITGARLLRTSGLTDEFLGALYASIGAALIIGSVFTWQVYFSSFRESG